MASMMKRQIVHCQVCRHEAIRVFPSCAAGVMKYWVCSNRCAASPFCKPIPESLLLAHPPVVPPPTQARIDADDHLYRGIR